MFFPRPCCSIAGHRPRIGAPPKGSAWTLALLVASLLGLGACGARGSGAEAPALGTVSLINESDLGQAPVTIYSFFFQAVGDNSPPLDHLSLPVGPGGVVIVGQFAEGTYNGLAVIDGGFAVPFNDVIVVRDQPTNLTVP